MDNAFTLSKLFTAIIVLFFLEVFPLEDHVKYFSSTDWFPITNSDEHSLFSSAGVPPSCESLAKKMSTTSNT